MKIEVGATNLETEDGGDVEIYRVDGNRAIGACRNLKLWRPVLWDANTGRSLSSGDNCNLREKTPEWYETIPPASRIPCWVSDTNPAPTAKDRSDICTKYDKGLTYPFICEHKDYRYATPIKPSECWGYKGEGK